MKFLIIFLTFIGYTGAHAQNSFDSLAFNNSFVFNNGIYTSLEELKYNSPSYPDCELDIDKKKEESIDPDQLYYINSRHTRLRYESELYATVVEGHLSIYYKNELSSVFLKGALSTFILKELVTTTHYPTGTTMGQPGYGRVPVPYTTTSVEINIYFLDFQTGLIAKVEKGNLEPIIRRDPVLYESFRKIKGDSNHKKSYPFISQYNARNPVYIMVLPAQNTGNDQ